MFYLTLYYDARKHKIKIINTFLIARFIVVIIAVVVVVNISSSMRALASSSSAAGAQSIWAINFDPFQKVTTSV